mgnify:FL=1
MDDAEKALNVTLVYKGANMDALNAAIANAKTALNDATSPTTPTPLLQPSGPPWKRLKRS